MKREQVDQIFDTFLKSASHKALEEMYDEYIESFPELEQEELPALDETMKRIFQKAKATTRGKKILKVICRTAAALLIAIGIGGVCIMSVNAWRVSFANFVLEVTDGKVVVDFTGNQSVQQDRLVPSDAALPEYVPDGFQIKEIKNFKTKIVIEFASDDAVISYEREELTDPVFEEFTLDGISESIKIGQLDGRVITQGDMLKVIWVSEAHYHRITGPVEKSELIRMAESVNSDIK